MRFKFTAYQQWWDLLMAMTEKEIKVRYKKAVFGFLWLLLNPIIQMIIIGTVFQLIIKFPIANYYIYIYLGLLAWNFFSVTVTKCTPLFVYERYLLKKAMFPREILPLSVVFSNGFHLLISLVLLIPLLILFRVFSLSHIIILPFALIWLISLTISISLIFSVLNVRYRDVNMFVQAFLPLLFYATPIAYSLSLLPSKFIDLFCLNPMTGVVLVLRYSLMEQEQLPLYPIIVGIGISILLLVISIILFKQQSQYFDDWL